MHRPMPFRSRLSLLLLLPLPLVACQQDGSVSPPDPELAVGRVDRSCPADIVEDIRALFTRGHVSAAVARCRNIAFQARRGGEGAALRQVTAFAEWAMDRLRLGQLQEWTDPGTEERLADLITRLMALAGASADFEVPEGALGPDGGFWIVGEEGGEFVCASGECGLAFAPGTFEEPTPVYCAPILDDPSPLNTQLPQYPRFFDCAAAAVPAKPFVAGLCTFDDEPTHVGHNVGEDGFELLPFETAAWLDCDIVDLADAAPPGTVWGRIAALGRRLLGIRPLHATALLRGPLGGLAGSFSEFGAVDASGVETAAERR